MFCVVELCYVPVVLSLDLLIMHAWLVPVYAVIEGLWGRWSVPDLAC